LIERPKKKSEGLAPRAMAHFAWVKIVMKSVITPFNDAMVNPQF